MSQDCLPSNLLQSLPPAAGAEVFEDLLRGDGLRVERIVSTGQCTPPGQWYDQAWDEWVLLLAGGARLQLEGEAGPRELRPGDHLFLPAHRRHRVEWTDPERPTVWLAIHADSGRLAPVGDTSSSDTA